jgi:hypothetical protein
MRLVVATFGQYWRNLQPGVLGRQAHSDLCDQIKAEQGKAIGDAKLADNYLSARKADWQRIAAGNSSSCST